MKLLKRVALAAMLGALIGAAAGWLTSDFSVEGAAAGAIIGALLGTGFGARIDAHRSAADSAVQQHMAGTRSIHKARRDMINAAAPDQELAGRVHGGADYTGGEPR